MNETHIVTSYYVTDKLLSVPDYEADSRSRLTGIEILAVAVKYFRTS